MPRGTMRHALVVAVLTALTTSTGASADAAGPANHARLGDEAQLAIAHSKSGLALVGAHATPRGERGPTFGLFLRGSTTASEIAATGATPGTILSGAATATGTLDQLQRLAQLPGLSEVDVATQSARRLDISAPEIDARANPGNPAQPSAWSGTFAGGFTGVTGSGVVVGVVDSGIDIANADFQTPSGTRIRSLWDQVASSGTSPSVFGYGAECSAGMINSGGCGPFTYPSGYCQASNSPEQDCDGHGTHVTGIAASNGRSAPAGQYIGIAPQSDIVFVKTDFDLAHVVDGVNYIFQKAQALGEPAVVNLSLGPYVGPHDGTSTFETMLDGLAGPGRLIVAAAGNQATHGSIGSFSPAYYHAGAALAGSATATETVHSGGSTPAFFDIWYPAAGSLRLTVAKSGWSGLTLDPSPASSTAASDGTCNGGATTASDPVNGDTVTAVSCSAVPGSGDNEIQFVICNSGCTAGPKTQTWSVSLKNLLSGATSFNAWAGDQNDYFFSGGDGNDTSTVSAPATAHQVISAGSYTTRVLSGFAGTVGSLSNFSSIGPTRDGRQGIDIAAPGEWISSSLSAHCSLSYCTQGGFEPDPNHLYLPGTSMAAPHVAGALALMLSTAPALTPAQARAALGAAARVDAAVGTAPNVLWGAGKLRVPQLAQVPGNYHAVTPVRIADSRPASTIGGYSTLGPGGSASVQVAGVGGVPADGSAEAVILNVTMVAAPGSAPSYATIWPGGAGQPGTSNLNYQGNVVQNLVEVPLGAGGRVNIYNNLGQADFIFDLQGWESRGLTGSAGLLRALPAPARILDTRAASRTGGCSNGCVDLGPHQSLDLQVDGAGGLPQNGIEAVVLNLTVQSPSAPISYITAWPAGQPQPLASNINFTQGQTVANRVAVTVGQNGRVSIYNNLGTVHVIVDAGGWYTDSSAPAATNGTFTAAGPARLFDTRNGTGTCALLPCSTLGPAGSLRVFVAGHAGVPAMNAPVKPSAVVMNVTAVVRLGAPPSYLTVWPGGTTMPLASDLNFGGSATTIPNLVVVGLASDGTINVYNNLGVTDVVGDVVGWIS